MISNYWFNHFLDARAEIREFFSLGFGRIVDTIMSFWNFLNFRCDVTPHQTKVDKLFRTTTLCISCRTPGPDEWWYVQVNNYEIVVLFFHISHNLTWYSAIVPISSQSLFNLWTDKTIHLCKKLSNPHWYMRVRRVKIKVFKKLLFDNVSL